MKLNRGGSELDVEVSVKAEEIISLLGLEPLPFEGGYYRETYRTEDRAVPLRLEDAPPAHRERAYGTAIYYLVTPENFSAFHRVESDEIFHFYAGDTVELVLLAESGAEVLPLGPTLLDGERPQQIVPKGVWQGLRLKPGGKWALLGCTVSPGFDFLDFHLGEREYLETRFPNCREWIFTLTR